MVFPAFEMVYKKLASIEEDANSSAQALASIVKARFSLIKEDKFLIIANCLDPHFTVPAWDNLNNCEELKKCMKVIVDIDRADQMIVPPTSNVPVQDSLQSRKRKSLFSKETYSIHQSLDLNIIEEELYTF